MTQNQIAYWNLQENRRTHLANESIGRENSMSNRITANANQTNSQTRIAELNETRRHNKATETIGAVSAGGQLATGIVHAATGLIKA